MPLNVIVGLLALLVALVLYSVGVWGAFRAKAFGKRHATYLFVGFAFDVLATAMMAISAGGLDLSPLPDLLHTVFALAVMLAMLVVAVAGWSAAAGAKEALQRALVRWGLVAWVAWVAVFVWGMMARGSARMGG